MTPNELYKQTPEKEDRDVYNARLDKFMPEIQNISEIDYVDYPELTRFTVKYYADPYIDGYRVWKLASLWLDDKPFMVIQEAGRGGRDHSQKFITDIETYKACVDYLQSFCPVVNPEYLDIYNQDDDIPNLTSFFCGSWNP